MKKATIGKISVLAVFLIACAIGYYFMFGGGSDKKVKEEYQKYVDMININHNFDAGSKGLDKMTTGAANKLIPTIKTDIKVSKELKNTSISLEDKKVDDAKESLDRAEKLDTAKTFAEAEKWLRSDIDNYKKAEDEINNLKQDSNFSKNVNQILEKYKFNYNSLEQALKELGNKIQEKADEKAKKEKEAAERAAEEAKKKKSDVELGGPNPDLLNDSNSLPANAQGIGGAIDEEGIIKLNKEMVNRYQGYLLRKYDGNSIEWDSSGKSFILIKANGKTVRFTAQAQLYARVKDRLVTAVRVSSSEGSELLYRT